MYKTRVTSLKKILKDEQLDALLISSAYNISYLTGASYFSIEEREAFILTTTKQLYLFTDGRYMEMAGKYIPHVTLVEISSSQKLTDSLKKIIEQQQYTSIGFESQNLTVHEYQSIKKALLTAKTALVPKTYCIEKSRIIKDKDEIVAIRKACELSDKTFEYILKKIKPGITEKQLSFELEYFIKKNGADIAFSPIIAFGPNSSVPHHQTTDQRLKVNDIVLLDFGAKVNNYCSDMTRTVFMGKVSDRIKKMYITTLKAQKKAIDQLYHKLIYDTSNIRVKDIDAVARSYIKSQGFPTIPHGLGHGVGLEVHESPRLSPTSKDILEPNMVFTIEPGIYIPGLGGVRIEDTVLLEKNNLRILTKSPKEIIIL